MIEEVEGINRRKWSTEVTEKVEFQSRLGQISLDTNDWSDGHWKDRNRNQGVSVHVG